MKLNEKGRTAKHKVRSHQDSTDTHPPKSEDNDLIEDLDMIEGNPCQHFHMDFGFVRGSEYKIKQEFGPTITSIDGFNSYLIIVDRVTRYAWIYLTISKSPPINIVQRVLHKFKSSDNHRTVRTDQGKELGRSAAFQAMVHKEGFSLEMTGSDASAQNAVAEAPNKYLANMMRYILHAANLGPEYWSYALIHAVYIKNRLPHILIKKTHFEALTGQQPEVTNLRVFGSRIYAKKPGQRDA